MRPSRPISGINPSNKITMNFCIVRSGLAANAYVKRVWLQKVQPMISESATKTLKSATKNIFSESEPLTKNKKISESEPLTKNEEP